MGGGGGIKLSILICSLESRKEQFDKLKECFLPQVDGVPVDVEWSVDDGSKSIGQKRQELLEKARGDYVCFVDDDDEVPEYYVEEILKAIETQPDCVGFWGRIISEKSGGSKQVHYSLDNKQLRHDMEKDIFLRGIGHLSPVKRAIALRVGFRDLDRNEDRFYSEGITPLLNTEVFIDKDMYIYKTRGSV